MFGLLYIPFSKAISSNYIVTKTIPALFNTSFEAFLTDGILLKILLVLQNGDGIHLYKS